MFCPSQSPVVSRVQLTHQDRKFDLLSDLGSDIFAAPASQSAGSSSFANFANFNSHPGKLSPVEVSLRALISQGKCSGWVLEEKHDFLVGLLVLLTMLLSDLSSRCGAQCCHGIRYFIICSVLVVIPWKDEFQFITSCFITSCDECHDLCEVYSPMFLHLSFLIPFVCLCVCCGLQQHRMLMLAQTLRISMRSGVLLLPLPPHRVLRFPLPHKHHFSLHKQVHTLCSCPFMWTSYSPTFIS